MAFDSGKTGAQVLAGLIPTGGTAGQALRKVDGTDGNAAWSTHWVVDQTTGGMSNAMPADATPINLYETSGAALIEATSSNTAAKFWVGDTPGDISTILKFTANGNFSFTTNSGHYAMTPSTQIGRGNTQSGYSQIQSGNANSQSGYSNTQSGAGNFQAGHNHQQTGFAGVQGGRGNTQSGSYGFQAGRALNDGGFDYTAMFGYTKTATVTKRAYFAMDNGVWLKPVAGDAASPENGVICYNATTHKFRGYANGVWVDLH